MLILGLLAAVAIAAILICLTFKIVKNWFKEQQVVVQKNTYNVLMKQNFKSGKHKTIVGIFNDKEQTLISATAWKSDRLDQEIEDMDRVQVLYNVCKD